MSVSRSICTSQQARGGQSATQLLPLSFAGHSFLAHASGALIWPAHNCVIVADMHLEKGSALAQSGQFLPPYDSHRTLDKLEALVAGAQASQSLRKLIFLGDSFQDTGGIARLPQELHRRLQALAQRLELIWITGNHDPMPTVASGNQTVTLPGSVQSALVWSGLVLRHEPRAGAELAGEAEMIGHFHPKARVAGRGRDFTRPCFLVGQRRLILPAFGAYVGGLHHTSPTLRGLFDGPYATYVLSNSRVLRLTPR